jgi:hypothetical protein
MNWTGLGEKGGLNLGKQSELSQNALNEGISFCSSRRTLKEPRERKA